MTVDDQYLADFEHQINGPSGRAIAFVRWVGYARTEEAEAETRAIAELWAKAPEMETLLRDLDVVLEGQRRLDIAREDERAIGMFAVEEGYGNMTAEEYLMASATAALMRNAVALSKIRHLLASIDQEKP